MFSAEYKLRYSDKDKNGGTKISTILDLLQDISIAHSDSAGLDLEYLEKQHIAFLLDGWRVKFIEPVNNNSKLQVNTGIMRFHKFETVRKYEIVQDDNCKVIATGFWYSVNTEKRTIERLDEDFYSGFANLCERDNGFEYTNLRPDKTAEYVASGKVCGRDIDTNNHMNNVKAVEFMLDYLPKNFEISELRVKYRKELLENEEIKIFSARIDDGYYVEIRNSDNKPCVLLRAF